MCVMCVMCVMCEGVEGVEKSSTLPKNFTISSKKISAAGAFQP